MKLRKDRWWNLIAALALLAAFLVTSFRIESTNWTEGLFILKWLTMIGFVLGLGFGYSYFTSIKTRIMIFLYSFTILPWSVAILYKGNMPWLERITNIVNRFGITLGNFFNNRPIEDPILFISFLTFLIWVTAFLGGFSLTRSGKPWIALIISAVTLITSEFYYSQTKDLYSFFFIIFALYVISILNFMNSTKKWQDVGTLVEFETELNIGKTAVIISFVLVFLAWNISGIVAAFQSGDVHQQALVGFFEDVRRQFSKLTAPLQGPLLIQQDFYGDSIGLGTGAVLGDNLVFDVTVDQNRPRGTRYYWRARTYDTYENDLWKSTIKNEIPLLADSETFIYDDLTQYTTRNFTFNSEINLGLLYTPTYPVKINRGVSAIAEIHPPNTVDLSAITLKSSLYAGESYTITANISTPSVTELRRASTNYPDWIKETYLQLPDNFSTKIRDLAANITENEDTTFDKVQAITFYLRGNILYKEQIPLPPENVDPMEWFLFDLKEGFCNYYASAEVLMLRSIGIPARMVYGYAQGDSDTDGKTFTVVRKQSHAWPEVFFPEIGWVEFEPTAAQPVITRLSGEFTPNRFDLLGNESDPDLLENAGTVNPLDDVSEIALPENSESRFSLLTLLPYLWVILFLDLAFLYVIKRKRLGISFSPPVALETFFEKKGWKIPNWLRKWSYFLKLEPPEKAFSSIVFSNFLLGSKSSIGVTPAELVGIFSDLLPEEKDNAHELLVEYQKILFSQYPGNLNLMKEKSKHILTSSIQKRVKSLFSRKTEEDFLQ